MIVYLTSYCSLGMMKISRTVNDSIYNPAKWVPQQQDIAITNACPAIVVPILQERVTRIASDPLHAVEKHNDARKLQPSHLH